MPSLSKNLPCCVLAAAIAVAGCGHDALEPDRDVELVTDGLGITHVYGASDADAFFGAGYAMARDRLFQMELNRRQARGTTAELLGAGSLRGDIGARVLGFAKLGHDSAAAARRDAPDEYALFARWVDGVNRRIDEVRRGVAPRPYGLGPGELDFVPAPWSVDDAFAVAKVLAFGLSNSLDAEILATVMRNIAPDVVARLPILQPAYDTFILPSTDGAPPASRPPSPPLPAGPSPRPIADDVPPFDFRPLFADTGSNNWALDGSHTVDGRPLLCGDPHQPLSSPTRLWPVHMSSVAGGGTLDVIGFAFVGTPTVELGHNAHVGWTATTNFADVMDLWDVSASATSVTLGDGTHPIVARNEVIRVAGEPDRTYEVDEVPGYGVLLPEEMLAVPKYLVAAGDLLFQWTGFQPSTEARAFLALDRARTLDDFDAAADLVEVGALNLVAADATGIDYHAHARVPDRGDPSSHPMPWHVLAAADAASLWTGAWLDGDRLPHRRAPASGRLFSANNDPWGFTADGSVENDPFYYGTFYAQGFRAHRIEQALDALTTNGRRASIDDVAAMQDDLHSPLADALVPRLTDALGALDSDPSLAAWRGRDDLVALGARLAAWDRTMRADSADALVFLGTSWFAAKRAFGTQLPSSLLQAIATKSPPFLLGALRNVVDDRFAAAASFKPDGVRALLVAALDDCAAWLQARFAGAPYRLSDMVQAGFHNGYGGALDAGLVPVSGGSDTIMVAEAPFFDGDAPAAHAVAQEMSLYRMAMRFDDDGVPAAVVDFARGTREDPASPHFADAEPAWVAGAHVPLPFRRADVVAQAGERVTLAGAHH